MRPRCLALELAAVLIAAQGFQNRDRHQEESGWPAADACCQRCLLQQRIRVAWAEALFVDTFGMSTTRPSGPDVPFNLPRLPPRVDLESRAVLEACIAARAALAGASAAADLIPNPPYGEGGTRRSSFIAPSSIS